MTETQDLATAAGSSDPRVGLRAVLALRRLLETLEALRDEAGLQAEIGRAYAAYEALLRERSLIDHADQIRGAVRLLEERLA